MSECRTIFELTRAVAAFTAGHFGHAPDFGLAQDRAWLEGFAHATKPEPASEEAIAKIIDALRMGRVACEWSEKHAEVAAIREATELAKSIIIARRMFLAPGEPPDTNSVFIRLTEAQKRRTSAENVADVLDAVARLMREREG